MVEAKDGAQALEYLKGQSYDLIILDIMLPYVDGWTICQKVRERADTPILMLTARQELSDKVKGFEIGADDYLVKPFEFEELKARVKALFRRSDQINNRSQSDLHTLIYLNGLFQLNLESRQLLVNHQLVELTVKEYDLLAMLASSPARVYTRELLLDQIWDIDESRDFTVGVMRSPSAPDATSVSPPAAIASPTPLPSAASRIFPATTSSSAIRCRASRGTTAEGCNRTDFHFGRAPSPGISLPLKGGGLGWGSMRYSRPIDPHPVRFANRPPPFRGR